jgi:uncharacterized protein (TIGR02391 family)
MAGCSPAILLYNSLMPAIPAFNEQLLQMMCDILGDTSDGLSGSDISLLLEHCDIPSPESGVTKRHRLYQALSKRQREDGCANHVIHFVQCALIPENYLEKPHQFDFLRYSLNEILSEAGYQIGMDGKFHRMPKIATGAAQRANQLRSALLPRNLHPEVMRLCRADLLGEHYLPVVIAAAKSLSEKIQLKTGSISVGAELADHALEFSNGPKLAFNTLQTKAEISEHLSLLHLIKSVLTAFNSPDTPEPAWAIAEPDAIDLLTLISMLHRRIDQAAQTGK